MKSFLIPIIVFFVLIGAVLVCNASQEPTITQPVQQAATITLSYSEWLPCLGIIVLFCFLAIVAFSLNARANDNVIEREPERAFAVVLGNQDPNYDPWVERDTFTNEEILQPGIDIRRKSHREHIKQQRRERKKYGWTSQEQEQYNKQHERTRPDTRSSTGYSQARYTASDYLGMLGAMFKKASIRIGGNPIFGGADMEFSKPGHSYRLFMSYSRQRRNTYTIVKVKSGTGTHRIIYTGEPQGALKVIKRWYNGEGDSL